MNSIEEAREYAKLLRDQGLPEAAQVIDNLASLLETAHNELHDRWLQIVARSTTTKDLPNGFMRNVWLYLNPDFKNIKYQPPTEVKQPPVNGSETPT